MKNDISTEYSNLKKEIIEYSIANNSLWVLSITTIIDFLTTIASNNIKDPNLCFFQLFIIVIFMSGIAVFKLNIIKRKSYIIAISEPNLKKTKFETRNFMLSSKIPVSVILSFIKYVPLAVFAFAFGILFCNYQTDLFNIIVTSVLMLAAYVICIYIMCLETNKKEWIKKWEKIKEKEDKVCGKH